MPPSPARPIGTCTLFHTRIILDATSCTGTEEVIKKTQKDCHADNESQDATSIVWWMVIWVRSLEEQRSSIQGKKKTPTKGSGCSLLVGQKKKEFKVLSLFRDQTRHPVLQEICHTKTSDKTKRDRHGIRPRFRQFDVSNRSRQHSCVQVTSHAVSHSIQVPWTSNGERTHRG